MSGKFIQMCPPFMHKQEEEKAYMKAKNGQA